MPFKTYDIRMSVGPLANKRRLDLDNYVPYLLNAISNKMTASASRVLLREYDCGVTDWRILSMLAVEPDIPPGRITSVVGIDKSSVSRALHTLEKRGCVAIAHDPTHRRRQLLSLTPDGQLLHDRIIDRMLDRESILLTGLEAEERQALVRLLKRLLANMPLMNRWEAKR
jgi:DNA-binding MarR family transcriptional regulator